MIKAQMFWKNFTSGFNRRGFSILLSIILIAATVISMISPALASGGELVCTLEEHIHSDSCYMKYKSCEYSRDPDEVDEDTPPEAVGDKILICDQEEVEGIHQHTEACWHTHEESCFTYELVCPLQEHIHGESCFSPVVPDMVPVEEENPEFSEESENEEPEAVAPNLLLAGSVAVNNEKNSDGEASEEELVPNGSGDENEEQGSNPVDTSDLSQIGNNNAENLINEDGTAEDPTGETVVGEPTTEEVGAEESPVEEVEPLDPIVEEDEKEEPAVSPNNGYTGTEIVITCSKEEHIHDELCYNEAGDLICPIEEHTHDDSCYEIVPVSVSSAISLEENEENGLLTADDSIDPEEAIERVLICELEEHAQHTSDCYDANGNFICTLPIHTHDESCYSSLVMNSTLLAAPMLLAATNSTYYAKKAIRGYKTWIIYPANDNENTTVAYCFDIAKAEPSLEAVGYEKTYEEATASDMKNVNSSVFNVIDSQYLINVLSNIIWLGAPYNGSTSDYKAQAAQIAKEINYGYEDSTITEYVFREATQYAIWHVTDGMGFGGATGTLGEKIYKEAEQNKEKNLAAESGVTIKLDLYETTATDNNGKNYQSFLTARGDKPTPTPTPTAVTLYATKTLDGTVPGDNYLFDFKLTDNSGNEKETVRSDLNGNITFTALEFTEEGTYTYKVSEIPNVLNGNPDEAGAIIYDASEYTVTIMVSKDANNALQATTSIVDENQITVDSISFNNKKPVEVTLAAIKTLDDRTPGNNFIFSFQLKNSAETEVIQEKQNNSGGTVNFDPIKYTEVGTYEYIVTEVANVLNGITDDSNTITYDTSKFKVTVTIEEVNKVLVTNVAILNEADPEMKDCIFNNTTNHYGVELPETGGTGTTLITTVGMLCLAAAAVIYMLSVKRRTGGTKRQYNR